MALLAEQHQIGLIGLGEYVSEGLRNLRVATLAKLEKLGEMGLSGGKGFVFLVGLIELVTGIKESDKDAAIFDRWSEIEMQTLRRNDMDPIFFEESDF